MPVLGRTRGTRRAVAFEAHHGVLVVDKPAGPSSHDVVAWVRWALRQRSVGHCGTLDPPATGVLVICVGEATKLAARLVDDDKRYLASVAFGRSTTTGDAEGDTLASVEIDADLLPRAAAVAPTLVGAFAWAPPNVSAIREHGVRAHARVRAGEDFELPARAMRIDALHVGAIDADAGAIEIDVAVGKGTYVRTLAEQWGKATGVPAHLRSLRRVNAGDFAVDEPGAVAGLVASAGPPRPDGKPRWRVSLGDGDRDRTGAILAAALMPADVALARRDPIVHARDLDGFMRLCRGQPMAWAALDPTAAPPSSAAIGVRLDSVVGGAQALVLASLRPGDTAEAGPVVHPQRVLDPGCDTVRRPAAGPPREGPAPA